MDPYSAGIGAVAGLTQTALNMYGAAQERKARKKAADLAQRGVGEIQGGKGYNADNALAFLGLTDESNYDTMDEESKGYSMQALKNLIDRGSGSGLDIQSKQALSEAINRSGGAQNAARQAVLQEYQMRGTGGAGAELGSALAGQQANYSQLAGATGQAAAAAEQRRLEANVLASRAGQQQQQLEQQRAAAKDALQRFNVGARQGSLDLENRARQGAATSYSNAANTMAGLAPGAGRPSYIGGQQIANAGMGLGAFLNQYAGGNTPTPQLQMPSMDIGANTQPTTGYGGQPNYDYGGGQQLNNPGYGYEGPQLQRNTGSVGGGAWG